MGNSKKDSRTISLVGGSQEGPTTEETKRKIARLDRLLAKVKSRIALRHKEWLQEIEKMPPKERALLEKGLSFYNLDSKGSES